MKELWVLVLLLTVAGGLFFVWSFAFSTSAPQQAAGAAIGIGIAVIPYCFARACAGVANAEVEELQKLRAEIGDAKRAAFQREKESAG